MEIWFLSVSRRYVLACHSQGDVSLFDALFLVQDNVLRLNVCNECVPLLMDPVLRLEVVVYAPKIMCLLAIPKVMFCCTTPFSNAGQGFAAQCLQWMCSNANGPNVWVGSPRLCTRIREYKLSGAKKCTKFGAHETIRVLENHYAFVKTTCTHWSI